MDKIKEISLENGWKKVCGTEEYTWKNCGIPSKTSCFDCKQGECPIPAVLRQVENVEEAYDLGYSEGLDMGYCDGYEDGIRHIPPTVADDDLEAMYEDWADCEEDMVSDRGGDLYICGNLLDKLETIKHRLHDTRHNISALDDVDEAISREFNRDLLYTISLIIGVQEQYVLNEMYRYLGYIE